MKSSYLHFKFYRLVEYTSFFGHYIYCKLFHAQSSAWESWKGAIVCDCSYATDLGYSYGQHCEACYNRVTERFQQKQDSVM